MDNNKKSYFTLDKLYENKYAMVSVLVLLSLYSSIYVNNLSDNLIYIIDNSLFKFIIFMLITYISVDNPTLGITLAIAILVTLQVISNIQLKKEIATELPNIKEKFSFNSQDTYDYNENPLLKINELDSSINNFNLEYETPTELYKNMLKEGKLLLDDSFEMQKNLKKRPDIREQRIEKDTRRDALSLIDSGLNRLQTSNSGEYNMFISDNISNNYIELDSINNINITNPEILSIFNILEKEYSKLRNNKMTEKEFNKQINLVYRTKLKLLEKIFINKKDKMCKEKIDNFEIILLKIKNGNLNNLENFRLLEDILV